MAKVVCRFCKKEIDKNIAYSVKSGQYFCDKNCYDDKQRTKIDNGKTNKIKYKPQQGTNRREFTDYVQMIYVNSGWNKHKINWSLVCAQASNILNEHPNWSYDTLIYVLQYMYEILGLQLVTQESNYSPLSLIPFYSQDAEDYFMETQRIEEVIDNFDFDTKPIVVKNNTKNIKQKRDKINIETLL